MNNPPRRPFQAGDEADSKMLGERVLVLEAGRLDEHVLVSVGSLTTLVPADDLTLVKPARNH
jgi:hypothetical protein